MSTPDLFRARLDGMVDPRHPLVVLTGRLPWAQIEQVLAPHFERKARTPGIVTAQEMPGEHAVEFGGGVGIGGRPRLPIRLLASLLYLKNSFNLSDEELVARWSENVVWQFFSGMEYYQPRLPCDATQIGRFRTAIGEEGLEQLLKITIQTAVEITAIKPVARYKVVKAAKAAGMALKQTFAAEGKELRRNAGGYAHAKQFKRLKKVVKRQRTILGVVMREVQRKQGAQAQTVAAGGVPQGEPAGATALGALKTLLERAERIRTQQRHDKNKLYALHAPEVECIAKGKARKPYEFGVKASLAVTHKQGLMVGARTFPGNPFDGHTLAQQLEQTTNLLQDLGRKPKQAIVDLGYKGVDADNPGVEVIHRGKYKTLTALQRRWLKRRQAIEPMIGHTKSDNRMDRCWLKGAVGDALHAVSCAAGYNIRWLMRAIVAQAAKAAKAAFLALSQPALYGLNSAMNALNALHEPLGLIRLAARASLSPPLPALPARVSVGLR